MIINIVSSILVVIVTAIGIMVQYSILKSIDNDDDSIRQSNSSTTINPMNIRIGTYISH